MVLENHNFLKQINASNIKFFESGDKYITTHTSLSNDEINTIDIHIKYTNKNIFNNYVDSYNIDIDFDYCNIVSYPDIDRYISVISSTTKTIPTNPSIGDVYIVPGDAVGVWSTYTYNIAEYTIDGWIYSSPTTGDSFIIHNTYIQNKIVSDKLRTIPTNPSIGDVYIVPGDAVGVWSTYTYNIAEYTIDGWVYEKSYKSLIFDGNVFSEYILEDAKFSIQFTTSDYMDQFEIVYNEICDNEIIVIYKSVNNDIYSYDCIIYNIETFEYSNYTILGGYDVDILNVYKIKIVNINDNKYLTAIYDQIYDESNKELIGIFNFIMQDNTTPVDSITLLNADEYTTVFSYSDTTAVIDVNDLNIPIILTEKIRTPEEVSYMEYDNTIYDLYAHVIFNESLVTNLDDTIETKIETMLITSFISDDGDLDETVYFNMYDINSLFCYNNNFNILGVGFGDVYTIYNLSIPYNINSKFDLNQMTNTYITSNIHKPNIISQLDNDDLFIFDTSNGILTVYDLYQKSNISKSINVSGECENISIINNYISFITPTNIQLNKFLLINDRYIKNDIVFIKMLELLPEYMKSSKSLSLIIDLFEKLFNGNTSYNTEGEYDVMYDVINKTVDDKLLYNFYEFDSELYFYDSRNSDIQPIYNKIENIINDKTIDNVSDKYIKLLLNQLNLGNYYDEHYWNNIGKKIVKNNDEFFTNYMHTNTDGYVNSVINNIYGSTGDSSQEIAKIYNDDILTEITKINKNEIRNIFKILAKHKNDKNSNHFLKFILRLFGYFYTFNLVMLDDKNNIINSEDLTVLSSNLINDVYIYIDYSDIKRDVNNIMRSMDFFVGIIKASLPINYSFKGVIINNSKTNSSKLNIMYKRVDIYTELR